MEEMNKALDSVIELLKAIQSPIKNPIASIPSIRPIKAPSVVPSKASTAKMPGVAPNSKKDPRKVAQQIKDGSMSTKTQKIMFKSETLEIHQNGQWTLSGP